jgi:hypothetical protein
MSSSETRRPTRVILLALIVLAVATWNGLRLGDAIFFWKTLEAYNSHPLYISISGGIWLISGLFLFWGIWMRKAYGWMATLIGTITYSAWYWFDRLFLQESHANWPFVLILNIIFLLLILLILFSNKTRRFFLRNAYERKPTNPRPA